MVALFQSNRISRSVANFYAIGERIGARGNGALSIGRAEPSAIARNVAASEATIPMPQGGCASCA